MSTNQIESCAQRIAAYDLDDAEHFRACMYAAANLTQRGAELRKQAWAEYRRITGAVKRPPPAPKWMREIKKREAELMKEREHGLP